MLNAHCPSCGYPIRPREHASIGSVAFCRTACVIVWCHDHGLTITPKRDVLPDGVERRRSA